MGKAAICEAWRSFSEDSTMPCPDQKEDAKTLILHFLDTKNIFYMYNTNKDYNKESFFDDLERNVCDLAARGLVELVLDRVQKNSDGIGLRACSLALLPYFLNRTGTATKLAWLTHATLLQLDNTGEDINSKYAAHILFNTIDYIRCDSRTKVNEVRYMGISS